MSVADWCLVMVKEELRPTIQARTTGGHKAREGRGFSLDEIKRAGLNLQEAKRQGIPLDKRRRTVHLQNVQIIKGYLGSFAPLTEIKGIGKAVEEELNKADILDVYDLAHVDIKILADKISHSTKTLERWQSEAKKLLKKKTRKRSSS